MLLPLKTAQCVTHIWLIWLPRPYQVDALVPGLVGGSKQAFAFRYCDGRMVPQRVPYSHAGQAGGPRPFRGGVGTGPGGEGVLRKRLETSGACCGPPGG